MVSLIVLSLLLHTSVALHVRNDKAPEGPLVGNVPWAPEHNLRHGPLVGFRVGVGWDEVQVEKLLGAGKSGTAYLVRYVKSEEFWGEPAILKVQNTDTKFRGGTRFESVAEEAAFMKKMRRQSVAWRDRTVPHTSQLLGDGHIWVPGHVPFTWKSGGEALLMTIAKGAELEKVLPLDDESMNTVIKDLRQFAKAMGERKFLHGDLTLENVFWDGNECTVIDFGTGQDLREKPKTQVQVMSRKVKVNAQSEVRVFLKHFLKENELAAFDLFSEGK